MTIEIYLIKVYILYIFSFDCYHIRSYWFLEVKPVNAITIEMWMITNS